MLMLNRSRRFQKYYCRSSWSWVFARTTIKINTVPSFLLRWWWQASKRLRPRGEVSAIEQKSRMPQEHIWHAWKQMGGIWATDGWLWEMMAKLRTEGCECEGWAGIFCRERSKLFQAEEVVCVKIYKPERTCSSIFLYWRFPCKSCGIKGKKCHARLDKKQSSSSLN